MNLVNVHYYAASTIASKIITFQVYCQRICPETAKGINDAFITTAICAPATEGN